MSVKTQTALQLAAPPLKASAVQSTLIVASGGAISIAGFSGLNHAIGTDHGAIVVVKAIASGGTASVVVAASCDINRSAPCIAGLR